VADGADLLVLEEGWQAEFEEFAELRRQFLIYS
jgi:hypothetical protein